MITPGNNALFLANLRERTRINTIASQVIVLAFVWGIGAYALSFRLGEIMNTAVAHGIVQLTLFLQALLLLLIGTRSVSAMTLRERLSGTLDAHRVSPTPLFAKAWGIVIGPAVLEWALAALLMLPAFIAWTYAGRSFFALFGFYVCLALSTLMLHAITAALTLRTPQAHAQRAQYALPAALFFVIYVIYSLQSMLLGSNVVAHLTALPAYYVLIGGDLRSILYDTVAYRAMDVALSERIYLSLFAMQFLLQGVHLVFAVLAIMRSLRSPGLPLLDKRQALAYVAYVYGLTLITIYGTPVTVYDKIAPLAIWYDGRFCLAILALGLAMSLIVTPSLQQHLRLLRRLKKLGKPAPLLSEGESNQRWLFLFGILSVLAALPAMRVWELEPKDIALSLPPVLLAIAYVAWFAGLLEWFRLSAHHRKVAMFVTALTVPYLFLPLIAMVSGMAEETASMLCMLSPGYTFLFIFDLKQDTAGATTYYALGINGSLACATLFLARLRQRDVNTSV